MDLNRFREQIEEICQEFDVSRLSVFGTVARGSDDSESDVDLLVRFKRPAGLLDLIRLEDRFADTLGRRVDLGTEAGLHPLLKNEVKRDLRILYEG